MSAKTVLLVCLLVAALLLSVVPGLAQPANEEGAVAAPDQPAGPPPGAPLPGPGPMVGPPGGPGGPPPGMMGGFNPMGMFGMMQAMAPPAIAVAGGKVFVAAGGRLYRFNADTLELEAQGTYAEPPRMGPGMMGGGRGFGGRRGGGGDAAPGG